MTDSIKKHKVGNVIRHGSQSQVIQVYLNNGLLMEGKEGSINAFDYSWWNKAPTKDSWIVFKYPIEKGDCVKVVERDKTSLPQRIYVFTAKELIPGGVCFNVRTGYTNGHLL